MSLRIRRGTDLQRKNTQLDLGEIAYTTDTKKLYVGDGVTTGGVNILKTTAGTGLIWDDTSETLVVSGSSISSTDIVEGTQLFFTSERAQDAVAAMFTNGNSGNSNVSFTYDDTANKMFATVTLDGNGIASVSADTSPQLGGNLVLNSHNITGTGNINVNGSIGNSSLSIATNIIETNNNGLNINSSYKRALTVVGISAGLLGSSPQVSINSSRGTTILPTALNQTDVVGSYIFKAYDGIGDYNGTGGIISQLSSITDVATRWPDSILTFYTGNNSDTDYTSFTFNGKGVLNAPVFKATSYTTATLPSSPEKGWIVYDSSSNEFKGWNGTNWVVLG